MSKLNVGVGEDFPLGGEPSEGAERNHPCARYWRHRASRHGAGAAAIVILPAAVASVTAAILYPLATLGVLGSAGLAAAAYRRARWRRYREEYRRWCEAQRKGEDKPREAPPEGPKDTV